MILHRFELAHVGPFRDSVSLGPFAPGLNVLAAANESGKSTAVQAAARALFDRHNNKSEELRALQPVGTDLAPFIAVEFETADGRYRIEKTFLQSPRASLKEWRSDSWQLVAEADSADKRMQELLHSSLPGKGATKAEHWGFLGFLWARQGEGADWPNLDNLSVGQQIRARLARVDLDPVIEKLRARLAETADAIITSTGQAKAKGSLELAEKDLLTIEADLATLGKARDDLESTQQRYHRAEASVALLEKEFTSKKQESEVLQQQAANTERLRIELKSRQDALATAQSKLNEVVKDSLMLATHREELTKAQADLTESEAQVEAANKEVISIRGLMAVRIGERTPLETTLTHSRRELERQQALLKLRELAAKAAELSRQLAHAMTASAGTVALEEKKTALPDISAGKLKKLEDKAQAIVALRAQLQALGLTVELTPGHKARAKVDDGTGKQDLTLPAGKILTLHSPQTLDLVLKDWGRVVVRSGAGDAQNAAAELAEAEADLRNSLQEGGVATVDAARTVVDSRKEIEADLKAAHANLTTLLGNYDTLPELQEASARAANKSEALIAQIRPTAKDQSSSVTEIETTEARLAAEVPAVEKALKDLDRQVEQLRTEEGDALKAHQKSATEAGRLRIQLATHQAGISGLTERYPEGIEAAKTAAQVSFNQAEARVVATKADLPTDFERLPDRNKRAARPFRIWKTTSRPTGPSATGPKQFWSKRAGWGFIPEKPTSWSGRPKRRSAAMPPACWAGMPASSRT